MLQEFKKGKRGKHFMFVYPLGSSSSGSYRWVLGWMALPYKCWSWRVHALVTCPYPRDVSVPSLKRDVSMTNACADSKRERARGGEMPPRRSPREGLVQPLWAHCLAALWELLRRKARNRPPQVGLPQSSIPPWDWRGLLPQTDHHHAYNMCVQLTIRQDITKEKKTYMVYYDIII